MRRSPDFHVWIVALCAVLAVVHTLVLADWFVEDAAISFAFARNLADGYGLVALPGGERVEGFSNPSWVGLLAVVEWLGGSSWLWAKGLSLLAVVGSVGLSYRIAWRLEPDDSALAAPAFLAIFAPAAIWSASGLENGLFTFLLLAGVAAGQGRRVGLAGLLFAGLALTRPEGGLYGVLAGLCFGRAFWVSFLLPVASYEAFRVWYFAWPLPNTYYAKLGGEVSYGRGWRQLRAWVWSSGLGVGLPILIGRRGGIRVLLLGFLGISLGFSVLAGGDWMRGDRWFSLASGPLAVLLATGLGSWLSGSSTTARWVVFTGIAAGLVPANLSATRAFVRQPVESPAVVGRRLAYTQKVAHQLGLDPREFGSIEMDMGAHLWAAEGSYVDLAGLVDVPIAHHSFADRAFVRDYIFGERRPAFAHVHRRWAEISGLRSYPEWEGYVELPPYDDGGRPHGGVFVRRDLLLHPWDGVRLHEVFADRVLVGARIRSPEVDAELIVELAWEGSGPLQPALEGGGQRWEVPLGHGYLEDFGGQTFVGRYRIPVDAVAYGEHELFLVAGRRLSVGRFTRVRDLRGAVAVDLRRLERAAKGGECELAEDVYEDLRAHGEPGGHGLIAGCWVGRGGLEATVRARYWDASVARESAARLARELYEQGAYADVLRLTPENAWARRARTLGR